MIGAGITKGPTIFSRRFIRLLLIKIAVVVVYTSALNLAPFQGTQGELANEHFFPQWNDNVYQDAVAHRLFMGIPLPESDGWGLSERPPLQAGLFLLSGVSFLGGEFWIQAMGVAINSSWFVVLAYLGAMVGLRDDALGRMLFLSIFVGFFFLNSVFVWPKMLAGTLVVLGAAFWWYAESGTRPAGRLWLGICAWGCAWFAHSATGFAILLALACGVAVALRMMRGQIEYPIWTIAVLGLTLSWLLVPWSVFKELQGGSSDVLLEYHLGGVFDAPPDAPAVSVVLAAYSELSALEILQRKLGNFRTLFVPMGDYGEGAIEWRRRDYYHLFFSLGFLNLGWVVWLVHRLFKKQRDASSFTFDSARLMVPFAGACLVLLTWVLVEFGPSAVEMSMWVKQSFNPPIAVTILHQGSYAPYILLVFVAASLTQSLRGRLWRLVAIVHFAIFAWFYVLTPRDLLDHKAVDPISLTLLLVGLAGLVVGCLRWTGTEGEQIEELS